MFRPLSLVSGQQGGVRGEGRAGEAFIRTSFSLFPFSTGVAYVIVGDPEVTKLGVKGARAFQFL